MTRQFTGTRQERFPMLPLVFPGPLPLLPGAQPAVAQAQLGMQEDERLRHIDRHLVAAEGEGQEGGAGECAVQQVCRRCAGGMQGVRGLQGGNPLRCTGMQQRRRSGADEGRRSQEAASAANLKLPPQQRPILTLPQQLPAAPMIVASNWCPAVASLVYGTDSSPKQAPPLTQCSSAARAAAHAPAALPASCPTAAAPWLAAAGGPACWEGEGGAPGYMAVRRACGCAQCLQGAIDRRQMCTAAAIQLAQSTW